MKREIERKVETDRERNEKKKTGETEKTVIDGETHARRIY